MMSSTIPRSVFNDNIREVYSKSSKLGDNWNLIVFDKNIIYLEKKEQQMYQNEIITIVYHIIYSESYAVPVLYLNISKSNGSIFKYDEIYSFYNLNQVSNYQESGLILTQQEHPLLFKPFYFMHPCKTSQWMNETKLSTCQSINFTLKWLSFVFSALRIPLDIKYALD
uniref:Ubiquitin-like-conjugating enzyme ATG10 n=1 Tax=Brachionus rotundiformis TaxID=96890 RepID=A0A2Z4EUH6_9BILA|nr:ubiquitin-like--conjugating enzyme ATG10 [Brachionus rotundiformis]